MIIELRYYVNLKSSFKLYNMLDNGLIIVDFKITNQAICQNFFIIIYYFDFSYFNYYHVLV